MTVRAACVPRATANCRARSQTFSLRIREFMRRKACSTAMLWFEACARLGLKVGRVPERDLRSLAAGA